MIVFGSTYTSKFSIWMSTNPKNNEWKPLVDSFEIGGWDPSFFTDDDGKFYMYNGSSNVHPLLLSFSVLNTKNVLTSEGFLPLPFPNTLRPLIANFPVGI